MRRIIAEEQSGLDSKRESLLLEMDHRRLDNNAELVLFETRRIIADLTTMRSVPCKK